MSDTDVMQACAEAVVRDVTATTSLRIELLSWVDPENGIGAVVHEAGIHPTTPVWEAVGCLDGGDSLALHPPSRPSRFIPESSNRTDVTIDIASSAQDLAQVLLWQRGLDPTWPACPEHQGRHPLRAVHLSNTARNSHGPASAPGSSAARWECPVGTTSIPIGTLPRTDGESGSHERRGPAG